MTPDSFSRDNVLVVSFGEEPEKDQNAYEALGDLERLDSEDRIRIVEAAVVTRNPDGRLAVKSEAGEDGYIPTASDGMIGLLLAILGGPLAPLLGSATGLLHKSPFDAEVDTTESVLSELSKQIEPTRTAVVAQVTEQSPEQIDSAMARLGGEVIRRPVADVEAEIAAAEEAQRRARDEARKDVHRARVEKTKADAHAKIEHLKSKLDRA